MLPPVEEEFFVIKTLPKSCVHFGVFLISGKSGSKGLEESEAVSPRGCVINLVEKPKERVAVARGCVINLVKKPLKEEPVM